MRHTWLALSLVLIATSPLIAAAKNDELPDKEMLRMMEFLREMEMIKQMEMMQDLHQVESMGDLTKSANGQKSPPVKNKEAAK
jgi:hypothetical protein